MNSIGLAVSFLGGCLLGLLLMSLHPAGLDPVYGLLLLTLSGAAILAAFIARGNRQTFWVSLLAAFMLLGVGRTLLIHPPVTPTDLAYYNASPLGPPVTVVGKIPMSPFSPTAPSVCVSPYNWSSSNTRQVKLWLRGICMPWCRAILNTALASL